MMASKYAGTCSDCNGKFPAGTMIHYNRRAPRRQKARHVDCENPEVSDDAPSYGEFGSAAWNSRPTIEVTTSGGTFYTRAGGRCEDAPCCGCCTF